MREIHCRFSYFVFGLFCFGLWVSCICCLSCDPLLALSVNSPSPLGLSRPENTAAALPLLPLTPPSSAQEQLFPVQLSSSQTAPLHQGLLTALTSGLKGGGRDLTHTHTATKRTTPFQDYHHPLPFCFFGLGTRVLFDPTDSTLGSTQASALRWVI